MAVADAVIYFAVDRIGDVIIQEIKERERPPSSSENRFLNRRTYSHKIEQNVVGLEEDTNLLLTQLVRTDCRVVAICGIGGLGKTTLAKKVYRQSYRVDASLEKLGREMVKHCRDLPLAIVVLGDLLSSKRTYDEWDTIHQCIKSYLKREDFEIFQLLALSYDDLPYKLKPYFLYLAMLPEDFNISRDWLINLWVAEGIILPPRIERESEESLEYVAYRCLTELTERYMVNVEKRDPSGRIKRCRMHDLMREFCLSKAEEEKLFQVLPFYGARERSLNISSSSAEVKGRVRRLSLHLNNFPGDIALECDEYPVFRLDRFDSASTIPDVLWKLKRLRHLYLPRWYGRGTKRLQFADLSDLRTLVNFPASDPDVEDLIRLTNLRKLKILLSSNEITLRRFKGIFESPTIILNYLRDLSILSSLSLDGQDVENIKSRCPRLQRLKLNGTVVYQTPDVFGIKEEEDATCLESGLIPQY
ncbi:putative disease resistance protein At1g59780 [Durio zibethinus]|uniref:Disease resistance protein At1g59780 n=1 Tax=Durio zibethinus TaxID=66656 RepID=A0A6P6ALP2_DURZI|nr:putative disease resistance protein At1g59780 [Durio zibethinus]